jgi:anti-anti-sigma regulatory factor
MSLVAGVTMAFVLLFGTPLIAYLPVPVLTGIVIAALIGILEIGLAKKLWKTDRTEFAIFMAAFAGVLIFGTIYGVMIGVVLSFVSVIIKASVPPRSRMGVIPGEVGFYNLSRNRRARAIKNTVIYRFNGALFFANIGVFQSDIEKAAAEDGVTTIIVDAGGISSVDTTAADRLVIIADKLRKKDIRFYITEHADTVNDQLRKLGAGSLVEEGVVRRTISLALRDAGVERPYICVDEDNTITADTMENTGVPIESNEALAEIEWAFGDDADKIMEKMAIEVATQMASSDNADETLVKEAEKNIRWGRIGLFDESELLDRIEMHLSDIVNTGKISQKQAEHLLEQRRSEVEHKLDNINPDALEAIQNHRRKVALYMKENNPSAYTHLEQLRRRHIEALRKTDPALAKKLEKLYGYSEGE